MLFNKIKSKIYLETKVISMFMSDYDYQSLPLATPCSSTTYSKD